MENKKLFKFLLNDFSELDELVSEKESNGFDDLEMEFIQSRIKGAKKLIQILYDRENGSEQESIKNEKVTKIVNLESEKLNSTAKPEQIIKKEEIQVEEITEDIKEEQKEPIIIEPENETLDEQKEVEPKKELEEQPKQFSENQNEKDVKLSNDEEIVDTANNRLGDSFKKEKSVNDLLGIDNTKLEHKLSNLPVESIQTAIGINDRFLFVRELFDGSAETFTNAVSTLDSKNSIKEAVEYLQQNFKWKKNETSLKFVNLVKRRFLNE